MGPVGATQQPPQRPRSVLGGNSQVPNVYWQALTTEQLRAHHGFVGLPPVQQVRTTTPETYRYVRQEDPLWHALHAGALTTSKLAGALGMREPETARRIGAPQDRNALLYAYLHLLESAWQPHLTPHTFSRDTLGSGAEHTAAGRRGYGAGAASGASTFSHADVARDDAAVQHNEGARRRYMARPRAPGAAAIIGPSEADKRRVSEVLALRGTTAVRLYWGSVQEASSLHTLLQLFPGSRLEEVGMYCQPAAVLGQAWGFAPNELPLMGASPDAVICHELTFTLADIQAGCAAMRQMLTAPAAPHAASQQLPASSGIGIGGGRSSSEGEGAHVPLAAGTAMSGIGLAPASAATAATATVVAERMLYGVLESALQPLPGNDGLAEAAASVAGTNGCTGYSPSSTMGYSSASINSSLQGGIGAGVLVEHGSGDTGCSGQAPGQPPLLSLQRSWKDAVQTLAQRLLLVACDADASGKGQDGGGADGRFGGRDEQQGPAGIASEPLTGLEPGASAPQRLQEGRPRPAWQPGPLVLQVREVVEVKNHCPFAFRDQNKAKKGGLRVQYRLSDWGPVDRIRTAWVPQLQMHCLAADAPSALLLSRSATKGVRLFRVKRDDEYIAAMLRCVSVLQVEHVARQVPPQPPLYCHSQPQYRELLDRTVAIAESAVLVADVAGAELAPPPGTDLNAFWGAPRRR